MLMVLSEVRGLVLGMWRRYFIFFNISSRDRGFRFLGYFFLLIIFINKVCSLFVWCLFWW